MLYVIICENDECSYMWWGLKDASKKPVREPECDAVLYVHVQSTAIHLVGVQPLISSAVTLIMHRIIALALYDTEQEKRVRFCAESNWNHMLLEPDTPCGIQLVWGDKSVIQPDNHKA